MFTVTKPCTNWNDFHWNVQVQSGKYLIWLIFISGFSLNVYFCLKCNDKRDNGSSNAPFYNIEVAPPNSPDRRESIVDVHVVEPGTIYTHCNRLACSFEVYRFQEMNRNEFLKPYLVFYFQVL